MPRNLETICLKCLNKSRDKRYQNAAELMLDLRRFLKGETITARRSSRLDKVWRQVRNNPLAAAGIAGAGLVILAALGWWLVVSARATDKIEQYRREANSYYAAGDWNNALVACENTLAIEPLDSAIDKLRDKCRAEIVRKQKADEKLRANTRVRQEAKMVLDRAAAGAAPDHKIIIAKEALKIDPTFGEAYQVIGYAYKAKVTEGGRSSAERRELTDNAFTAFSKAIELTPTLAYSYYERGGITFLYRNDPTGAIPDFEKVLEYDPDSYLAYFAKGRIEYAQKKFDAAIASYSRGLELCPDDTEALGNRGNIYFAKGDYDRALADYDMGIKLKPDDPVSYHNRGLIYHAKGIPDKAIADFAEAVRLRPDYADVYFARSKTHANLLHDYKAAIADVETGIKIAPNNPHALNFSVMMSCWKDEMMSGTSVELALKDYDESIRNDPKNAYAYHNRGVWYAKNGAQDRAIEDFNTAIKLLPKEADAFYNSRGVAYSMKGNENQAMADFTEALRINPESYQIYLNRAQRYQGRGEIDAAIADYSAALRIKPDAHIYNTRGMIFGERNELDKAAADFQEAIRLDPKSARAFHSLGIIYSQKNDPAMAMGYFNQAIELKPDYGEAYYHRGLIYEQKGDLESALAEYNGAIKANPKLAWVYFNRSGIYQGRKDYDRAIADLSEAIRLIPNVADFYVRRAETYGVKGEFKFAIGDGETAIKLGVSRKDEVGINMLMSDWKRALEK